MSSSSEPCSPVAGSDRRLRLRLRAPPFHTSRDYSSFDDYQSELDVYTTLTPPTEPFRPSRDCLSYDDYVQEVFVHLDIGGHLTRLWYLCRCLAVTECNFSRSAVDLVRDYMRAGRWVTPEAIEYDNGPMGPRLVIVNGARDKVVFDVEDAVHKTGEADRIIVL